LDDNKTFHVIGGRYGPGFFTVSLNVAASGACAILAYIISLSHFTLAIYTIALASILTLVFSLYRVLALKKLLDRVSEEETVKLRYRKVKLGIAPLIIAFFIAAMLPIIVVAIFHSMLSFIAVLCILWGLVNSSVCFGVYVRAWEIKNRAELYIRYILKVTGEESEVIGKELIMRHY